MTKTKKRPNFLESISAVVFLLALIVYGIYAGVNTVVMLIIATGWVIVIAYKCGYRWPELMEAMLERLHGLMEVLLIIFSIGFFIAAMVFSGSIPALIYYLVNVIDPNFMVVLSFVITGLVAMAIGTSWGTAGTVGLVMVSIATSMGANLPMVAGAVISGAHVGQILSPMSDTSNVAANFAGTNVQSMIKRMAYYAVPVVVIAIVAYTILGFFGGAGSASVANVESIRGEIAKVFNVNPLVILPMVFVFILTFRKKPIISTLIISGFIAILFGVIFNGFEFSKGLECLYSGFKLNAITGLDESAFSEIFLTLVNRGGITSMISSVLLAIIATIYGALMTKIEAVNVICETLFKNVKSRVGLVASTVLVAGLVVGLTTSAYLAVLIASDLFKEKFHAAGMDDTDLIASCLPASSQFVVVFPWVDTAIYMAGLTGVA
ncbi:MAG: Na+/H+ antiporter NhaC family protein, partial [Erysipelotrichaceae bacterium]